MVTRFAIVLSVLALACGPDAGDYPYERTERVDAGTDAGAPPDAGPPEIPDEPLEDWDTTDAGPLSGIFAVDVRVKAKVVVEVEARQLFRLRILQRGRHVRLRTQPCRIDLPAVEGVAELSIPPALEAVLQTKAVEDEGELLDADEPVGAAFTPPPALIVLGAELGDPAADPLPTPDDDARALDEDDDGNPGVTVDAETVLCRRPERAYLALRAVADLAGTVEDLDTLSGDVTPTLEWSILGVTHDCLAAAAELEIEIVPGSTFRALRVGDDQDIDDNGNVSCPEIGIVADELFPEPEPDP